MSWDTVTSVGALLVSLYVVITRAFENALSIREHEEYKNQENQKAVLRDISLQRDLKRIEDRVDRIEQTRPTVGELEAKLKASSTTKGE